MITEPRRALRTARLVAVIASGVVIATTVVVVGAITPGYSQMSETVSRLGSAGQPHAWLERAGILLYGLLVVFGAGALGSHAPSRERLFACAIGGYGIAAVVSGLAPKDPPHAPHTLPSQIHVDASLFGGAMMLVAMVLVARYAPVRADRTVAAALAGLTGIGVIVFRFTWGSSIYGLVERALLAIAVLWLALLARQSLRA